MSITFFDFKELSKESQYEFVITYGRMISETRKAKLKFVLYEISSFSAEIVYEVDTEKVVGLNIFQNSGNS